MRNSFRHIISSSFVLCCLLSYSYGQKQTVSGTVRGLDGPLQAATVSTGITTILTNNDGEFSLSLVPGNYTFHISYAGYQEITQQLNIKEGKDISLNFVMKTAERMDEVVVLGSRSQVQRTNLSSPVPIDIISSPQLLQTAQTNLTQMLQFTVPSFNASRQLVNEPITLRGLDPDQVLILVNGKRYHSMAFLQWGGVRGILGRGSVSNDLNSIPFSAIEKIEILRDGASAQYGSDGIAGVINIHLKNTTGKTWAQLHAGQFYRADGDNFSAGINRGFVIGKKGFLNFSAALRFQKPTYRGGKYLGTVYKNYPANATPLDSFQIKIQDDSIVNSRNFNRSKVSNAGSSEHKGFSVSINGGYPLNKRTELFWTVTTNKRKTIFISGHTVPKNEGRINPDLYPDGFQAKPSNHSTDVWAVAGVKGETKDHLRWEYSSTYGNNSGTYYNHHTNNASQYFTMGKNAPTSFYTGGLVYGQLVNSIHASKNIFARRDRMINLGFGTEWRFEHFQIKTGEEASWENYDATRKKQGGSGGLVFSAADAAKGNRNVAAAYIDLETEYANRILVNLAARYEYFSDFGSNLAGKIALRYKLSDQFSVRSSFGNGFRAPSLQQQYYSLTRIGLPNGGNFVTLGIFRTNSNVAKALGIPSLYAERSINVSSGLTANIQRFRITVDAYYIEIKNRIVLSGVFSRNNTDVDRLLNGITNVDQVQFFTNAINTRTKGVDIVLNRNWKIRKANLLVMFAANFTQTRLYGEVKRAGNLKADALNSNTLFDRAEKGKLEKGQPADKTIFSIHYKVKNIALQIRNTRFGKTAVLSSNLLTNADENFFAKILTDLHLSYSLKKWLTITAGTNNLFNVYPDPLKDYRNTGDGVHIYGQEATPFGFNGGYYFVSMEIKW